MPKIEMLLRMNSWYRDRTNQQLGNLKCFRLKFIFIYLSMKKTFFLENIGKGHGGFFLMQLPFSIGLF